MSMSWLPFRGGNMAHESVQEVLRSRATARAARTVTTTMRLRDRDRAFAEGVRVGAFSVWAFRVWAFAAVWRIQMM